MFKRCTCCDATWSDAHSLLIDEELTILGVQDDPDPAQLLVGLQHTCGTTLYVALASLVNVGVSTESLAHCTWHAIDGLPHGAQRLVGEAIGATAVALTPAPLRESV
jgi:hypothetical protein